MITFILVTDKIIISIYEKQMPVKASVALNHGINFAAHL